MYHLFCHWAAEHGQLPLCAVCLGSTASLVPAPTPHTVDAVCWDPRCWILVVFQDLLVDIICLESRESSCGGDAGSPQRCFWNEPGFPRSKHRAALFPEGLRNSGCPAPAPEHAENAAHGSCCSRPEGSLPRLPDKGSNLTWGGGI